MADGQGVSRGRRIAAIAAVAIVALAALAFLFRDYAVEAIAESYFASSGTQSDVAIDSWDGTGLHLHLALGADRAFTAEQVTIAFDPRFWLPHVDSVTVKGAKLAVGFDGRAISFGSLQKLIDSFRKPKTRSWTDDYIRAPLPVTIEDAQLVVNTPAGAVAMAAHATLSGSRILGADVHASPATLQVRGEPIHLDTGSLVARWNGSSLDVKGEAAVHGEAKAPGNLRVTLNAPHVSWTNGTYAAQSLTLDAAASGSIGAIAMDGTALHIQVTDLSATVAEGNFAAHARYISSFASKSAVVNGIQILPAHVLLDGEITLANKAISLVAHINGDGGFPVASTRAALASLSGFSAAPEVTDAIARAALSFHATATIEARSNAKEQTIRLVDPINLTSASGASASIAQRSGPASWLALRDGRVNAKGELAIGGGGLPAVKLNIDSLSLARGAQAYKVDAAVRTTLAVSTRAFRNVFIAADAHLTSDDNTLTLSLDRCAAFRVGAVVVKRKNELSNIAGLMCADAGKPLLSQNSGGWQFGAGLQRASANFPDAGAEMNGGAAHIALAGDRTGLQGGSLALNDALLSDRVNRKFAPLRATGNAKYGNGRWSGRISVQTTLHRTSIATIDTVYNVASGRGRASISAPDIKFTPKGLAPTDISPLLAALAQADGSASFHGVIDWTAAKVTSSGTLDTEGLRFASPMGAASDSATHIRFISLLPPETAPNQAFAIGRIDWLSPIKTVAGDFHLKPQIIEIGGVRADVAGGTVKIDPLTITLGAKQGISAGIKLSEIDLGQLLADSNLASKVHLVAVASGSIPLTISGAGIHITNGVIASTRPGRISIDRSLWTSGAISTNAMQDFAYQALENLAFDTLRGELNSQPNGRLQIVLHIQGHSDPPAQQEARVGLFDLLRGEAFNKSIPLPKGTPIDLTLDTSLNFDELLRAYQAARSPTISAP